MSEQETIFPDREPRRVTLIRIEEELWAQVKAKARRQRLSANAYVCNAVERAVRQDDAGSS